eukprot:gb/GECH01000895.1/.p1 GENE.gb/GECH01000895.1/~~gb/GECH01000895.1/.p1  ORF type:complete len:436 (+),score=120.79 gb/GECH01000895.1/:1-1308(+)
MLKQAPISKTYQFHNTHKKSVLRFQKHITTSKTKRFPLVSKKLFSSTVENTKTDPENHFPFQTLQACHIPLHNRGILEIQGSDAENFIQGLSTNDTRFLTSQDNPITGMSTLFLNPKGRVLFDALLSLAPNSTSDEPRFFLECDRELLPKILQHLNVFKLRKKVTLKDISANFDIHCVLGSENQNETVSSNQTNGSTAFQDPRLSNLGVRVYKPKEVSNILIKDGLQSQEESFDVYTAMRTMHGVAEGTQDLPTGEAFPFEANIDLLNGISFRKGCYIGQELTARTHFVGETRKRLMPVYTTPFNSESTTDKNQHNLTSIPSPSKELSPELEQFQISSTIGFPNTGSEVRAHNKGSEWNSDGSLAKGRRGGRIASHVHNIGLALLRIEHVLSGKKTLICDGYQLHPIIPQWLPDNNQTEQKNESEQEQNKQEQLQ